jgi:hypothetical protein
MRIVQPGQTRVQAFAAAYAVALRGVNRGGTGQSPLADRLYLDGCTWYHRDTGTIFAFTRDVGHHSSGWWKNPDYERCFHLSLSFRDPRTDLPRPRDLEQTKAWVRAVFGQQERRYLWCEPPFSPTGKELDVWHYRLFCNERWQPFKPRGEVYSKKFTEAGWKSWSDVQADLAALTKLERERAQ